MEWGLKLMVMFGEHYRVYWVDLRDLLVVHREGVWSEHSFTDCGMYARNHDIKWIRAVRTHCV